MYVPEGPLPPRPHASGKGGPSLGATNSPPVGTASPAVIGTPTVGSTLTCSQGTWFNSPTSYAYQWKRDGTTIVGSTASTYVVVAGDLGHSLTCTVTATNAFGSTPATSNAVLIVAVPANTAAPVASGSLTVGSTLSCTQGTWTNSPTSYAYQWQRGGTNIAGATSASYVTVSADGGTSVGCLVTANNAAGSASQASNTLAIAGGVATSVWSASDAAANGMTLSNGGLTVALTAASNQSVRSTISQTAGKYYIEFMTPTAPGAEVGFGIASSSFAAAANYLGNGNYSFGAYNVSDGNIGAPAADFTSHYSANGNPAAANDVWAFAVDLTAGLFWLARNNVWFGSGNPGAGTLPMVTISSPALGQTYFPGISGVGPTSGVWTLQATAASQKYAPPSGFTPWG